MIYRHVLSLLLFILPAAESFSQQQQPDSVIQGYVTRATSLADFDASASAFFTTPVTTSIKPPSHGGCWPQTALINFPPPRPHPARPIFT
jgi:hypothetical protein